MFSFKLMRAGLVLLLLTICCCAAVSVGAQGLVGAPVNPHGQQSYGVGIWAGRDYDSARDIVRIATAVSVLLACLIGWFRSRKVSGKRLVTELFLLVLFPLAVYLSGIYSINNIGGIGS